MRGRKFRTRRRPRGSSHRRHLVGRRHDVMVVAADLVLAVLLAAVVLTVSVGVASGSRGLTVRPGGAITASSNGRLTLQGGGLNIECNAALTGLLATSATKVVGGNAGTFAGGSLTACNLGVTFVVLFPAAWRLSYNGFTGALPSITGVRFIIRNIQILVNWPGVGACLFEGEVPVIVDISAGTASRMAVGSNSVPVSRTLSGICPTALRFVGTFDLSSRQSLSLV